MGKISKGLVVQEGFLTKEAEYTFGRKDWFQGSCRFQHLVVLWDILGAFLGGVPCGGGTSLPWSLAGEQVPALHGRREGINMKDIRSLSQSIPGMQSNFSKGTAGVEGRILSQKLQREDGL